MTDVFDNTCKLTHLAALQTRGYVVIRRFLDPELIGHCKEDYAAQPEDGNNNYGISLASEKLLKRLQPAVNTLLAQLHAQTDLRPNHVQGAAFFACARGIDFGWHQDHESFFTFQNHYDYLNLYIPVTKPEISRSNLSVIPFDKLQKCYPDVSQQLLHQGASRFIPFGRYTLALLDHVGKTRWWKLDLQDLAETPSLAAGDLLLLRGDVLHRTQDNDTARVAMSLRIANVNSPLSRSRLAEGGFHKLKMMKNNPGLYARLLQSFEDTGQSEMTYQQALDQTPQASSALTPMLLRQKRDTGNLLSFLPKAAAGLAAHQALQLARKTRARMVKKHALQRD